LILIGLEVGDHTPKEVRVSPTIKGPDRDRSGDDSGRTKRQNQRQKKAFGPGKESDDGNVRSGWIQHEIPRIAESHRGWSSGRCWSSGLKRLRYFPVVSVFMPTALRSIMSALVLKSGKHPEMDSNCGIRGIHGILAARGHNLSPPSFIFINLEMAAALLLPG
jgi:hypothetical protein